MFNRRRILAQEPRFDNGRGPASTPGIPRLGPQVDSEDQHAVLQGAGGIAQHGEVLIVELHALHEPPAIGPFEGGYPTATDGLGPFPEPGDQGVDVELGFCHRVER